jgi:gliding motility-associated-like protein
MRISLVFLILIYYAHASAQDTIPANWNTGDQTLDRTDCIPITNASLFQSGTFDNGHGTLSVQFCADNACGIKGVLNTNKVVDWITIISGGNTSRRIGVGRSGYLGPYIFIPPSKQHTFQFTGHDLAFTGPVSLEITTSHIIATGLADGDDGYMEFIFQGENPKVLLESNLIESTVWRIGIEPYLYCPDFQPRRTVMLCPGEPLVIENPCPNIELPVTWELPDGTILDNVDSIYISSPTAGVYYGMSPCQQWEVHVLDPRYVHIQAEPIACSNRTRLSLPVGLVGRWSTGVTAHAIEVTSGTHYALLETLCGLFSTDTISVVYDYHDFAMTLDIYPDEDTLLLYHELRLTATSNADTIGTVDYKWNKDGFPIEFTLEPLAAGRYTVTAYYDDCTAYDTIYVLSGHIPKCVLPTYSPNAFTPNDDGINDVFTLDPSPGGIITHFSVYNRWGELMFNRNNSSPFWDGLYKNEPLQPGVFVWTARVLYGFYVCELQGDITLIR